ncbi:hypothetical protein SAMN06265379_102217 [Saccharicrinis carchari]|uniref:histidine kinase n=1 Tax=Saccharicrinis carchari TaxID=1168039 RepID=A0A521BYV4_SACCC|nr:ATP-binding protein [Saccharicrinis carchari]SMO52235.1 hypothetical protein SAMN06265379_102217 [Saccharicrinis carchari]
MVQLLVIFAFLAKSKTTCANEPNRFIHLTISTDRGETNVSNVLEDSLGYAWLESPDGMLRFDGYESVIYPGTGIFGQPSPVLLGAVKDAKSQIWCVSQKGILSRLLPSGKFAPQFTNLFNFKDTQKLSSLHMGSSSLWLGSNYGTLSGFNLKDSSILRFDIHAADEQVTSISEYRDSLVWFGTNKGRVFKANTSSGQISELKLPHSDPFNTITLIADRDGNLWIGTETYGFFYHNTKTHSFRHYHNKANAPYLVPSNMVIRAYCDSEGIIWMGTDGGGLYRIDPRTMEAGVFKHSKSNPFSLQSNTIIGINETSNNDLWVFTNYGNINLLPEESTTVGYLSGSVSGSPARVLSILKTKDEILWIGTDGEGISLVDKNKKPIRQYVANTTSARGLRGNYIQALTEAETGSIWVGTYQNGLMLYHPKKDRFTPVAAINDAGQPASDIRSLYVDRKKRIWVGSHIGVFVFSAQGVQLAFFPYNTNGLQGNIVEVFMEDEKNRLWLGTNMGGIALMHEAARLNESTFTTYPLHQGGNPSYNDINHGAADGNGHLYLVNAIPQLVKFDIGTKKTIPVKGFTTADLQGIVAVTVIDADNLWVSRNNGISHLDFAFGQEYFYSWKNGTLRKPFLSGSAFNDNGKTLYFGGVGGINYFEPARIKTDRKQFHLAINGLKIVNRDADEIIPEQLSIGIEQLRSLTLNHQQTSFSFGFSVINDYLNPNYFYAYRLKGFDEDWLSTDNIRMATYTNIPYGQYTFEVKAGSKRNVWDIGTRSVQIKILAPLWLRWWAIAIYLILFIAIGYFLLRYSIMWARLKRKLMMEEWQNEKNKELYELKMNFFAKMSHEIQTPLTLILSPLENMIERAGGNLLLKQRLQGIKNNAKRLSRIAAELMTVRNKELGKLRLGVGEHNMARDIDQIALSFMEQARFKHIDFNVEGTSNRDIFVWYDKEKLEHIIYNLLANAFKFTSREGKITLRVEPDEAKGQIRLEVSDTGIGIPEKDLKNIFDMYYQSPVGKTIGGTGIGLALTHELIKLHKGNINVSSQVNKGTTFTITLPLGRQHFTEEEILNTKSVLKENNTDQAVQEADADEETNKDIEQLPSDKKNILLVEDNYEMLIFLADSFKNSYHVQTAQNGREALDLIPDFKPDIIVSDVMMPIMDGITLCKMLKEKQRTRHIPVILLTTRNTTSSKLEGLKFGAIEYINKPFNLKELQLKVHNILEVQTRFIEQYRAEILTQSKDVEVESPDEKFIESVLLELEKNYEDPEFRLEELASALNMSYSYIYRKFQSLTGKTLVDFVRTFRLRKSIPLIEKHNFTIAEIAFRIGFNDPKYFSKCFKKEYGKTPKQYRLEAEAITNTDRNN